MIQNKNVAIFAAVITTLLGSLQAQGDKNSKTHNSGVSSEFELCEIAVRATKYHKTDPDADYHTRREMSSTGIKLREAQNKVIGTVATNPAVIPAGSLVLVKAKNGEILPYLSVDVGGAVTSTKASRRLAQKEGRPEEWSKRPVIDLYSKQVRVHDWTKVLVIKDRLPADLTKTELKEYLDKRMSLKHWEKPILEAVRSL